MNLKLITFGIVCIVCAAVGGGLKALGAEFPVLKSPRRQWLLAGIGVVIVGLGIVLNDHPVSPKPPTVNVSCIPEPITTVQTSQCSATVTPNQIPNSDVSWSASGGSISTSGVFTPSGAGTVTITATSKQEPNGYGSTPLTVTTPPPPPLPSQAPEAKGVLTVDQAERLCAALPDYGELGKHKAIVVNTTGRIATWRHNERSEAITVATGKCQKYAMELRQPPETCALVFVDDQKVGNWTLPTKVSNDDSQCNETVSSYSK
jgi:hypothetical protein